MIEMCVELRGDKVLCDKLIEIVGLTYEQIEEIEDWSIGWKYQFLPSAGDRFNLCNYFNDELIETFSEEILEKMEQSKIMMNLYISNREWWSDCGVVMSLTYKKPPELYKPNRV